jgi:hypothetical protein
MREAFGQIDSLEEMMALLERLDPDEPFPADCLRTSRAKDGRTQQVRLPDGYLARRDDDTPPPTHETGRDWEAALSGG